MSRASSLSHDFCWQELITLDTKEAVDFYAQLFNWQTRVLTVEGGASYTIFSQNDNDIAGMTYSPSSALPTQWLAYIAVESLELTIKKALALGATLLLPQRLIPHYGHFAVIKDPQGATLAFWEKILK